MTLSAVTTDQERWDAFVHRHGGGFLQSWGWSRFQEALGRKALRFQVGRAGGATDDAVAQFLLITNPLPFGRTYAYVPRGPIVASGGDAAREDVETSVLALREAVRRERATFIRFEWPWPKGVAPVTEADLARWGLVAAKSVQPSDTVIMDLARSEEELLSAMHQKTRYNIRVAEKHGVTVRDAAAGDMDMFWAMLDETAGRDRFHTHPKTYYATMLETLGASSDANGLKVRLVFAEHGGRAIAAALIAEYGGTVTYLHGASISADRRLMAPYLLHWRIMQDAKQRGFTAYDFWGVAPTDDPEHPWAGITRFKKGFGGREVAYLGAWELPGNRFWYTVYRYAKRLRNI